jgi:hypothetical protein
MPSFLPLIWGTVATFASPSATSLALPPRKPKVGVRRPFSLFNISAVYFSARFRKCLSAESRGGTCGFARCHSRLGKKSNRGLRGGVVRSWAMWPQSANPVTIMVARCCKATHHTSAGKT